jgi:hypothetical protein
MYLPGYSCRGVAIRMTMANQLGASWTVLADESIVTTGASAFGAALGNAGDIHVAVRIGDDSLSDVVAAGTKLVRPV